MHEMLGLFYLGVLVVVIACGVYLFVTRPRPNPSLRTPKAAPGAFERAESLKGKYRLSELESILAKLASFEAWDIVMQFQPTTLQGGFTVILGQNEIELLLLWLDQSDSFRQAAATVGLEVYSLPPHKDIVYILIAGSWREIAETVRRVIREMYDLGDTTEIEVEIVV